jgi:hypothetical protein
LIKIRYQDLPAGLHVLAEAQDNDTIVYLLPGLTTEQRRAALHRARSGARMGYGPELPAARFACAVAADRVRTTLGNSAAAMRVHPGLVLPPVIIMVSAVLAYMLLATMSTTYRPPGAGAGLRPQPVSQGVGPPGPSRAAGIRRHRDAPGSARDRPGDRSGSSPGSPSPSLPSGHGGPRPGSPSRGHHGPSPSPSPAGPRPDPSPSGGPPPSRPPHPSPSPSPFPFPSPFPSPFPFPSPVPSPAPSGSGAGGCLPLTPLGVCVRL